MSTLTILHTCALAKPGDPGYQVDALGQPAHIATVRIARTDRVTLGWRHVGTRCDGTPIQHITTEHTA